MKDQRSILIYYDHLLPYSATFVKAQAASMSHFSPYYVGSRRVSGIELSSNRVTVVNDGSRVGSLYESFYKLFGVSPRFYQRIRNVRPLLIHAHFGPNAVRALPIVQRLGIPLVVTFHGYDVTIRDEHVRQHGTYSHKVYLQKREVLKTKALSFIAVSKFVEKKLLEQGFPKDKIYQHYIGIDLDFFQCNPELKREKIVLFVARLVEKKGCEFLIRAMSKVQEKYPNAKLLVIGEGPLLSDLEALAQRKLKNYEFLGVQPPKVIRDLMNRSQVFCVPSVEAESGDSEAFGMVFAEAQAMGLPVVSFDSGGISEVVVHEKTGFLASEKNFNQLSFYIEKLLADESLRTRFSHEGQKFVRSNFNLLKQTRLLEDLYEDLLRARS